MAAAEAQAATPRAKKDAGVPKVVLEATRAAVLAAHSAAGLAWEHSKEVGRTLRAAEALCRSAAALLAASRGPPATQAAQKASLAAPAAGCGKSRSARRRRRQAAVATSPAPTVGATEDADMGVARLELGNGNVVIGDLREFGLGTARGTREVAGGVAAPTAAEAAGGGGGSTAALAAATTVAEATFEEFSTLQLKALATMGKLPVTGDRQELIMRIVAKGNQWSRSATS